MNEQETNADSVSAAFPADEIEVRDLLRTAGPRPAAPEEDLESIKAAARVEWLRVVAERENAPSSLGRAILALAASLLLALVAGWWWIGREAPGPMEQVASVERTSGSGVAASFGAAGDPIELLVGAVLPAGAQVETPAAGVASPLRLALRLAGGQSVRLDSDSRVRIVSARRLELERGALYLDSGLAAETSDAVEITTAFGVVRDIGTQFEVRLETGGGGMRVRVREGEVVVAAGSEIYSAVEGEELSMDRAGQISRAAVPRFGSEWDWVMAAAPSFDIEGRSLRSFLDWASRETGLWLRFEDESLERFAAEIEVIGTIDSLTPEQALGAVMPSSGLAHSIENGVLLVYRPR